MPTPHEIDKILICKLDVFYSGSRLDAIQFDLSPNLSPKRREALNLTPQRYKGWGWGLGLYCTQLRTAIAYL